MEEIRVRVAGGEYPVYVGRLLYEGALAGEIRRLHPRMVALVSHPSLFALHGERVFGALEDGLGEKGRVTRFLFPHGEEHKNLDTLEAGYSALLASGMNREDVLVAFGGGVVGDVAGFMAATYMRGIRYLQVATTLMAMVDSSIGGKVGVDLPGAKNAVGSFHQPLAVFSDTGVLETLPAREMRSGMAEVAKYGFLYDGDLLGKVEAWERRPHSPDVDMAGIIARCAACKARVVEKDERDLGGIRAMLNYGHTFAHAIESAAGFGTLLHGEAVAAGMMMAARLSELMGLAPRGLYEAHRGLLMPLLEGIVLSEEVDADALLFRMGSDKKRGASTRFVLLERPQAALLVEEARRELVTEAVEDTIADIRSGDR